MKKTRKEEEGMGGVGHSKKQGTTEQEGKLENFTLITYSSAVHSK